MNEFEKISKWVSEVEESLVEQKERRKDLENRIARKLTQVTLAATRDEFLVSQEKINLLKRLSRFSRIVSADDVSEEALKRIEKEIEETYDNGLSKNKTYYFGQHGSGAKEAEEVEELYGDQSKTETFYPDRSGFEDDGEFIDEEDMLDLDMPGPYDFGPQRMLNERDPEDF